MQTISNNLFSTTTPSSTVPTSDCVMLTDFEIMNDGVITSIVIETNSSPGSTYKLMALRFSNCPPYPCRDMIMSSLNTELAISSTGTGFVTLSQTGNDTSTVNINVLRGDIPVVCNLNGVNFLYTNVTDSHPHLAYDENLKTPYRIFAAASSAPKLKVRLTVQFSLVYFYTHYISFTMNNESNCSLTVVLRPAMKMVSRVFSFYDPNPATTTTQAPLSCTTQTSIENIYAANVSRAVILHYSYHYNIVSLSTIADCNYSSLMTLYEWQVYRVNGDTGLAIEQVGAATSSTLEIQAASLPYGNYSAQINATFMVTTTEFGSAQYNFTASNFTYFKIKPTGFNFFMFEYETNAMSIGYAQSLRIDPNLYSYDIDGLVNMSAMTYKFYCSRVVDQSTLVSTSYDLFTISQNGALLPQTNCFGSLSE